MPDSNPQSWTYGYIPRDYEEVPEFSAFNEFSGDNIPRSQWSELIDHHNEHQSMPVHWHKKYLNIESQGSWGYCWMYGTVACVANRYAMQGVGNPNLCAWASAYRGKSGRNVGGYGVEACRYIQDFGIPSQDVFPEFTKNMNLWKSKEVIESADKHKLVDFEEFGRSGIFDSVVSAILNPDDPSPCTLAFTWWGHLVAGVGVAKKGNDFGLIIANSWGTQYNAGGESNGYGILWGNKAVPFEAVRVRKVKARDESE